MNRHEREDLERALAAEDRFWERQSILRQLWKADQAEGELAGKEKASQDREVAHSAS